MPTLEFLPLRTPASHLEEVFASLMYGYIAEMNEHSHRPLPEQFQKKWIDSILSMRDHPDRVIEICCLEREPIGFLYGRIDHPEHEEYTKPGWGYIMEFYIKPSHRRKGFGTKMYRHLQALFHDKGIRNLYLTADPVTGKPFWEAIGFQKTDDIKPSNQLSVYILPSIDSSNH